MCIFCYFKACLPEFSIYFIYDRAIPDGGILPDGSPVIPGSGYESIINLRFDGVVFHHETFCLFEGLYGPKRGNGTEKTIVFESSKDCLDEITKEFAMWKRKKVHIFCGGKYRVHMCVDRTFRETIDILLQFLYELAPEEATRNYEEFRLGLYLSSCARGRTILEEKEKTEEELDAAYHEMMMNDVDYDYFEEMAQERERTLL